VIHLGNETGVVVPLDEYRRLQALARIATPEELDKAEDAAEAEHYKAWSAAGRPGAISQEEAKRLLLGDPTEG
jgi:hypothetical protein